MVVRLTSFMIAADKAEEAKRIYKQEVISEVKKQKGNEDVMLLEPSDGSTEYVSVTTWKTMADADAYESSGIYRELVDKLKGLFSSKSDLKTFNLSG
ncbi:MAG: antibiotic biosynthesis monooxygenase family protein [Ferruginibacter sp.]